MKFSQLFVPATVSVFLFFLTQTEAGLTKHRCFHDIHCSPSMTCSDGFCKDPCTWTHDNRMCTVINHIATYPCRPGFKYPTGTDRICLPSEWSCSVDEEDMNRSLRCEIPHNRGGSLKVRLCDG